MSHIRFERSQPLPENVNQPLNTTVEMALPETLEEIRFYGYRLQPQEQLHLASFLRSCYKLWLEERTRGICKPKPRRKQHG